ncbi:MAG TPA: hypothetical protein VEB42_08135 [Chitinophagaceae bacterium]|nr:hypothetical protein [Chitinophagaceae bacterium]
MKERALLIFTIILTACNSEKKHNEMVLHNVSGLTVPPGISNLKYQFIRNDEQTYPYIFYSRFKCDSASYLLIQNQVANKSSTARQYAHNQILSGYLLAKDDKFLNAFSSVSFWDVKNKIVPEKIYSNYFDDGKKQIGDSAKFNGKIVVFFDDPDCYLFIECLSPPSSNWDRYSAAQMRVRRCNYNHLITEIHIVLY